MGSFGCLNCFLNANHGGWIIVLIMIILDQFDDQREQQIIRILSFYCLNCYMNNDKGGWIIMIITIILLDPFDSQREGWMTRIMLFDCFMNNNQGGGWIIIIILLSLTILLDQFGNQNKWIPAIWYHFFFTLVGSDVRRHKLFVALSILAIIFTFIRSDISM